MSLVITGAAGHLGRRTAELLLDRVDPSDVVLVSRRAGALEDLAARGATVRHVTSVVTDSVGQRIQGALVAVDRRAACGVEAELASITVCELVRETAAGELRRAG